jgi:ATP-dependent Clp protease ATP-binding subunit ClpC
MAATRMCDVCGVRPAVVTVRRAVPGEPPRTENLCEVHAAEAGVGGARSPFWGSSLRGGGSLFDEFFGRFFDEPATTGAGPGTRGGVPRRRAEQVDITQYFSDATNELLQRAAQRAMERGSLDLTNEHLLSAALGIPPVQEHRSSGPSQFVGHRPAQAVGRAGDQDYLFS